MNDHESFDSPDIRLGDRMNRAVGGLRAPDLASRAMVRGRRQRTHRRLAHSAGGVAALTAVALVAPAITDDWPRQDPNPSSSTAAADPTSTSTDGSVSDPCGPSATGWWTKTSAQIRAELSTRMPAGISVGPADDPRLGAWEGNLVTGDDADFASLTLLPPPGTPGGLMTLDQLATDGPCSVGTNEPLQPVLSCDALAGHTACEEIRSEGGALVGVITEKVEQQVVDGQEQPTDRTYLLATLTAADGGHVELYVAEGTRADRPDTEHDPDDVPALDMQQAREIVTAAAWTT